MDTRIYFCMTSALELGVVGRFSSREEATIAATHLVPRCAAVFDQYIAVQTLTRLHAAMRRNASMPSFRSCVGIDRYGVTHMLTDVAAGSSGKGSHSLDQCVMVWHPGDLERIARLLKIAVEKAIIDDSVSGIDSL